LKLREYRRRHRLTLVELARRIGVSEGAVSRYETGARVPCFPVMARISRATAGAVSPNDFFDVNGKKGGDDAGPVGKADGASAMAERQR
jgi:transcriptional regulator with XRE-family HTH domain